MPTSVIENSVQRFTAEPEAARSAPSVTAALANGRARLSAGPFNWDADLPPAVGGENLAPSPTAYLLGALAGCAVVFIRDTLAPQLGLQIDDVSAVTRCTSDARGLLGMDGAVPDLDDVTVDISVVSSEPEDKPPAPLRDLGRALPYLPRADQADDRGGQPYRPRGT